MQPNTEGKNIKGLSEDIDPIESKCQGGTGLFLVKNGNEWINESKGSPIPRMLFSELWYESELCILFADTNVGKSILAVLIADSISRSMPIPGFKLEAEAQPVLYFDFELSKKQFENRYSVNYAEHYRWHNNFYRAEIDPDAGIPEGFLTMEEYINESLNLTIEKTQAKVLIIDNLTYLKNETERAKDALPLMRHLKDLKRIHGLSILALAHTPKRDPTKPLHKNDLQGSKMLMNFCDSSFALGQSYNDKSLRYIKQIKQRNTEELYGDNNIILCQITKPANFLQLSFIGYSKEWEHLKERSSEDEKKRNETIMELQKTGLSTREIAKRVGMSHSRVNQIIREAGERKEE